jgi:hypothetical protein
MQKRGQVNRLAVSRKTHRTDNAQGHLLKIISIQAGQIHFTSRIRAFQPARGNSTQTKRAEDGIRLIVSHKHLEEFLKFNSI